MSQFCYIILTIIFNKEKDGKWTARCKELGTSTFANTFDEVHEDMREAVTLHLNTLEDVGERKRFFKERGIKLYTSKPPRSIPVDTEMSINSYLHQFVQPITKHPQHVCA